MSSFGKQPLLPPINNNHKESPLTHRRILQTSQSLSPQRESPSIRHRGKHHRNKKHKFKPKTLFNVDELPQNSNGIWIQSIIQHVDNKESQIHCISVCKSYNFDAIHRSFDDANNFIFARYEDSLHFKIKSNNNDNILESIVSDQDIFVFQNEGVIVFWNVNQMDRAHFVSSLQRFEINYPLNELSREIVPQIDQFDYILGQEFEIENGAVSLSIIRCFDELYIEKWNDYVRENTVDISLDEPANENESESVCWKAVRGILMMQKLAISFGLAQSLKFQKIELRVDANIALNENIPKQMAFNGSIGLNGKEIGKRMGRLFVARSELALHSDVLDTPEHFYENDLFGREYEGVREYLNIDKRIEIINSRFDLLHGLFEIIMPQQETSHASKLEWIIIWLIVIEIVLGIAGLFMEYFK